ncbi:peptidyl-prolyl cis-trans isomerase B (cyclophilin B) [Ekhidna lutea]|uniref:peptidylprolyl isomerase n=1 Tax=Ekhidna lutea TaxID=447679 RepID=A0A239K3V2_EKHLU|nr:peptidylprolyl isomerase [Ekhidna lutea]SNT12352.1 peptidyl-prolyl cis-trans isomerase B (cyclophilin B) [Ekhidna lutea]
MHLSRFLILSLIIISCSSPNESADDQPTLIRVELTTSMGAITLELSDKTPLHRDNFIKLVNDDMYDSIIFHRVLQDFVVQAGEFDSLRQVNLDSSVIEGLDYRVPAEFDSTLFHKRGALGAARTGNPERASSNIQFYIVHRGPRPDSLINKDEERINDMLRLHYVTNAPENKMWLDSINSVLESDNYEAFGAIYDTLSKISEGYEDFDRHSIPEYQREVYRTLGGTPHLDQNYTVFGEVVKGMNVVDSIAAVPVAEGGRPIDQVMILEARILTN